MQRRFLVGKPECFHHMSVWAISWPEINDPKISMRDTLSLKKQTIAFGSLTQYRQIIGSFIWGQNITKVLIILFHSSIFYWKDKIYFKSLYWNVLLSAHLLNSPLITKNCLSKVTEFIVLLKYFTDPNFTRHNVSLGRFFFPLDVKFYELLQKSKSKCLGLPCYHNYLAEKDCYIAKTFRSQTSTYCIIFKGIKKYNNFM